MPRKRKGKTPCSDNSDDDSDYTPALSPQPALSLQKPTPDGPSSGSQTARMTPKQIKDIEREVKKRFEMARIIKPHGFSLERMNTLPSTAWSNKSGFTEREIDLSGITDPVRVVDEDDDHILYADPHAKSQKAADKILDITVNHAHAVKLKAPTVAGADGSGWGAVDNYRIREGQVAGVAKDVRSWQAIGQWNMEPVSSKDMIKSGYVLEATAKLHEDLAPLSVRCNTIMQVLDPEFHAALTQLRDRSALKFAHVRLWTDRDLLLFEGREIMYNRESALHVDSTDPKRAYVVLSPQGHYTGGALNIPEAHIRVRYDHRTIVAVRGRALAHRAEAWSTEQRVSIAHFTHQAFWNHFGMTPPPHDRSKVPKGRTYTWENLEKGVYTLPPDIKIGPPQKRYVFVRRKFKNGKGAKNGTGKCATGKGTKNGTGKSRKGKMNGKGKSWTGKTNKTR